MICKNIRQNNILRNPRPKNAQSASQCNGTDLVRIWSKIKWKVFSVRSFKMDQMSVCQSVARFWLFAQKVSLVKEEVEAGDS